MDTLEPDEHSFAAALDVAGGKAEPKLGDADAKLFSLLFRRGECTAVIDGERIRVWYSWRMTALPSTYFAKLAPMLVFRLMRMGGLRDLAEASDFSTGPGSTDAGRYAVDYDKKWVRMKLDAERIVIKIRATPESLDDSDPDYLVYVARCRRCDGELRTLFAKQCLHCGLDWH